MNLEGNFKTDYTKEGIGWFTHLKSHLEVVRNLVQSNTT